MDEKEFEEWYFNSAFERDHLDEPTYYDDNADGEHDLEIDIMSGVSHRGDCFTCGKSAELVALMRNDLDGNYCCFWVCEECKRTRE